MQTAVQSAAPEKTAAQAHTPDIDLVTSDRPDLDDTPRFATCCNTNGSRRVHPCFRIRDGDLCLQQMNTCPGFRCP